MGAEPAGGFELSLGDARTRPAVARALASIRLKVGLRAAGRRTLVQEQVATAVAVATLWGVAQLRYVVALLALMVALSAHAQIFSDSEARKAILELRAKLADQERALQQKDVDLSARLDRLETAERNQLELANQAETLRQEIARLRGQIEALTNEVATLQKRNRDLYADLDARLKKMEPSTVAVDGKPVAVDRSELTAYETALAQFRASDFKGALASFQQFVARFPQSAYVPVAHYWIGSSHYALKEYKSAIAAQQILVDRYQDSTRAPDALLSIAESQLQLGDKRSANRTLGRLIKDYSESDAAKVARERLPATR